MKSAKMIFVAVALMLVTAGVFAGKAKFLTTLYAYDASISTFFELSSSVTLAGDWSTVGTIQAKVTDNTGAIFPVYLNKSLTQPVYVTAAF